MLKQSAGFTIIESLVAIVVVGILLAAVSSVVTLSTATRVQARRVELATQAARAYIDGVRSGVITAPPSTTNNLADYPAPTSSGSLNCTANAYCLSTPELYCVDFDGSNCNTSSATDMIVQAFRQNSITDGDQAYSLGLRVYRADAFKQPGILKQGKVQLTFTGGLGDSTAPLVEMTTEIVTDHITLRDWCERLGCGTNPRLQE